MSNAAFRANTANRSSAPAGGSCTQSLNSHVDAEHLWVSSGYSGGLLACRILFTKNGEFIEGVIYRNWFYFAETAFRHKNLSTSESGQWPIQFSAFPGTPLAPP